MFFSFPESDARRGGRQEPNVRRGRPNYCSIPRQFSRYGQDETPVPLESRIPFWENRNAVLGKRKRHSG
ncbi:hypothetical protein [Achromobacter aegrifaciens]